MGMSVIWEDRCEDDDVDMPFQFGQAVARVRLSNEDSPTRTSQLFAMVCNRFNLGCREPKAVGWDYGCCCEVTEMGRSDLRLARRTKDRSKVVS
ncbi:hypothetical protein L6452_26966 [Arctium lappa]|uniref:Uncharacterized protein n=1 Tax=Arctium lappa TaxID=4217 RepID=A0ACB8ZWF0_ARCLA|nr:hypothetical protein L6452_26966 [Arctium lappa]